MITFGAHAQIWVSPVAGNTLHVVEHVRDLGFDAIDINVIELPPPFPPHELRQRLEGARLQAALGTLLDSRRDITSPDAECRRAGIDFLKGMLRLCSEVGARALIGPYHSEVRRQRLDVGLARAERWERCVEGLAAVAREAERLCVTMAIEPLNRYESDFLTTTADGVHLCELVGSRSVGLLLDTYHMNIEEREVGGAFRAAKGHVAHIHLCENDRGAPGSGHIDWRGVRDAVHEVGYTGVCTIESYNPGIPALAQRASFWRPLSPTQDDLAQRGLAFLRQLFDTA